MRKEGEKRIDPSVDPLLTFVASNTCRSTDHLRSSFTFMHATMANQSSQSSRARKPFTGPYRGIIRFMAILHSTPRGACCLYCM